MPNIFPSKQSNKRAAELLSFPIPNLIGGVSQQPDTLKLLNSSEIDENVWPSVVTGLNKRPPTEHIAKITPTAVSNGVAQWLIDRSGSYRYSVVLDGTSLYVRDFSGAAKTVSFPDGSAYLSSTSPASSFSFVTVGDTTFILNSGVTVTASSVTEDGSRVDPGGKATVCILNSYANSVYAIYINGVLKATMTTNVGVDAATSVQPTTVIATTLGTALTTASVTNTVKGSSICLSGLTAGHAVQVYCTSGDKAMRAYTDTIDQFVNLPPNEVEGRVVRVQGSVKDNGDDYYVVYKKGIWYETFGYGEQQQLDPATMPHILVRNTDGTFTFKRHTWLKRQAGDSVSNPVPSFVNTKINDIYVFANRFGFLADENFILSEANVYESFFRTSLATLVDSDPIDSAALAAVSGNDTLKFAIPFDKDLLLMSDRAQFRVSYTNFLGPKNINVQYTSSFNVSPNVPPVNIGQSVMFVDDNPETYTYAKVMEYYTKDNRTGDDADEITKPVPQYIPTGVQFLTGSPRVNAVALNSSSAPNKLFVYKYYWAAQSKIQNAWFTWTFEDCTKIESAVFSKNYLYLILTRPDGVYFERVRCDEQVFIESSGLRTRILLDRLVTKSGLGLSYNSTTKKTTITLPYSVSVNPELVGSFDNVDPTLSIQDVRFATTKLTGSTFTVDGDVTGYTTLNAGVGYNMQHRFSKIYIRSAKGQSEVVNLDMERLMLKYLRLEYHDTGYFNIRITYPGAPTYNIPFDGRIIGDATSLIGRANLMEGVFSCALHGHNKKASIDILNDSPYPCSFGSAEFSILGTQLTRGRV